MAQFEPAIEITLRHEGGYYHNPKTGEHANFGITIWLLRNLKILPPAPRVQAANQYEIDFVKSLTVDEAKDIYRLEFWYKLFLDHIENQTVANHVFDLAVNTGLGEAIKLLQQALNQTPRGIILKVDGVIGVKTITAVNATDPVKLLGTQTTPSTPGIGLLGMASNFYIALAKSQPVHVADLPGWLKRLDA